MTFLNTISKTITDHRLIKTGDTIVVGVSGGADSIALLEVLSFWKNTLGLKIVAGHIHHGLRKTADDDALFVAKLCAEKNIPCETVHVRIAKKSSRSIEELAREKRFAALIAIAKKYKADSIALAHHQDDLAETVLIRLMRGTGLQGLQAILPTRVINGLPFIRPLIYVTRDEIEKFLSQKKISYRTDPTNTDTIFLRNKIRHHLLPLLKKQYNPKISSMLAGLAETAGIDYDFLSISTQKTFQDLAAWKTKQKLSFSNNDLTRLHPAVLRAVLRNAIHALNGNTTALTLNHIRKIENLLNNTPKENTEIHLPHGVTVVIQKNTLLFTLTK